MLIALSRVDKEEKSRLKDSENLSFYLKEKDLFFMTSTYRPEK